MTTYDFSTLNDKDFEELSRDLLNAELKLFFQSFTQGRDGGIDLRYATVKNENNIIVQAKHYLGTGYSGLKSKLKNEELPKVENMTPKVNRYILITSVKLTPLNKKELKRLFKGYIQTTNDILGQDDLNGLLVKHGHIEKKYHKLWFSNTLVLEKIFQNAISGRSSFIKEKIEKHIQLYVETKAFEKALNIIRNNKIVLITGIPGIGKSTLANMLTYHILGNDFELVYIDGELKEAEELFDNSASKQLFYFDDFLGSNYIEIVNSKNTDSKIVNFIERISSSKNKYLILTTRSSILNQAKSYREKLNNTNLDNLKYEIELKDYSDYDKAKILYNHLYFYDLEKEYISKIFEKKNYWKIIKHSNYNPRLIDFFSKKSNIKDVSTEDYVYFIMKNLNNPNKIWEHAIQNQLDDPDKYLLFTLLTFRGSVKKEHLEIAFKERISYEVNNNGYHRRQGAFEKSFKHLLDGFINHLISRDTNDSRISFVNPSIGDYLISFFNLNNIEKWDLINSLFYIEQFSFVFEYDLQKEGRNKINIKKEELERFIKKIDECQCSLYSFISQSPSNMSILIISVLCHFRNKESYILIDEKIESRLDSIIWADVTELYSLVHDILPLFLSVEEKSRLYDIIKKKWIDEILPTLLKSLNDIEQIEQVKELCVRLGYNLSELYADDFHSQIDLSIKNIYLEQVKDIKENELLNVYSEEEFQGIENDVWESYTTLYREILGVHRELPENMTESLFADVDIEAIIQQNQEEEARAEAYMDDYRFDDSPSESYMIDNLFSSMDKE
ncbi:nSTAND3 domain-containing NTPase [Massilibacteroides vaginae]|uniref:nSTAND3 domain-containing NTPase n=1 Tax=Massilibacteroides vaginae TaxID=1673718 RepID=UPI001593E450|nr:ATP-binding protein [Massilibacteroides vaginae]